MKVLEKCFPVQNTHPRLCLRYNVKALKPDGTYTCPGSGPGRGISLGINIPTRMPKEEIMIIIIHQDLNTRQLWTLILLISTTKLFCPY